MLTGLVIFHARTFTEGAEKTVCEVILFSVIKLH